MSLLYRWLCVPDSDWTRLWLRSQGRTLEIDMQAEQDLAQMLYKTAAFVPVDMGGEAEHPLALLANCVEDDRMIAMVPKGAAMVSSLACATL